MKDQGGLTAASGAERLYSLMVKTMLFFPGSSAAAEAIEAIALASSAHASESGPTQALRAAIQSFVVTMRQ